MPVRNLPDHPSLEHLRHQARTLQRQVRTGVPGALATVRELHPRPGALAAPANYGLGRGDGGPWRARLGEPHPSPAQLLEDELLRAARDGLPEVAQLMID